MAFTSLAFPPSTPLFPRAAVVLSYLQSFASHFNLAPHIRLNTTVQDVEWDGSSALWKVALSTDELLHFHYLVVANGHYRKPRYPQTLGLHKWLASGKASHSAWYRRPHYMGQVILVVGRGPSAGDISKEMCSVARLVIQSMRDAVEDSTRPNLRTRGPIIEFCDNGRVVFADGTSEDNIDHCILATGYEMSFPFFPGSIMKPSLIPSIPPLPFQLHNSTYNVFPLMKHLFPLQCPFPPHSIAFPGLPSPVIPFPFVEAQAYAIVKSWLHPESLDASKEAVSIVTRFERYEGDQFQISKAFMKFEPMEQFEYRDELYAYAFAGDSEEIKKRKVPILQRELFDYRFALRDEWLEMERNGESDDFVRGVGEGGDHEWESLMWRLLDKIQARQN
jgi:Flavin-binding monooxygenase-like